MNWKDKFPKENIYFETDRGILYCGDCLEVMKEFPRESIDLALTDPPYGIRASKGVGGYGITKANEYEDNWDKKKASERSF